MFLIQNPPCTPAILAATAVSIFSKSIICIDWHNLGYTLYLDRYNESHKLVRLARFLEKYTGMLSHKNICVSNTMKLWLKKNFDIEASVLYDRPPKSVFKRSSAIKPETPLDLQNAISNIELRHNLFSKLKLTFSNVFLENGMCLYLLLYYLLIMHGLF
jgi:beta-1,4-mannosyltransferase